MVSQTNQNISKTMATKADKENALQNVILITLDDFSYEVFIENIEMFPNMRELKNNCVSFENAFSVGPMTFYAFPGIIGGVYPYHFGIGIDKNIKTIDGVLKDQGYNTALINEANALLTPFFGYGKNIDFQKHFLNLSHSDVGRRLENAFTGDNKIVEDRALRLYSIIRKTFYNLDTGWIKKCGEYSFGILKFLKLYLTDNTECFQERKKLYFEFQNGISEFINTRFERPQFLWVHTVVNHLPYFPIENRDKFSLKEIDYLNYRALSRLVNPRICRKLKLLYIESMKRTDELIGDILNALQTNNLLDNTILVVTSDHGEEFMEEGYFEHSFESSSDRLLRVPLMFYSPNMFKPKTVSVSVSTIDILPTIVDLLNLKIPDSCRGVSLKEILLDASENQEKTKKFWHRSIYSEGWTTEGLLDRTPGHKSNKKVFTVRKGQYKLKVIQKKKNADTIMEKFELINWVNNEKLDIESNNQLFEELHHLLYGHIYEESVFAKYIRDKAEKQRIKKIVGKIRIKHRNF